MQTPHHRPTAPWQTGGESVLSQGFPQAEEAFTLDRPRFRPQPDAATCWPTALPALTKTAAGGDGPFASGDLFPRSPDLGLDG
jgi:hypothetical protein